MKRVWFILVLCLMLSGCSIGKTKTKDIKKESNDFVLETQYYTVTVPQKWDGLYEWQIISLDHHLYALSFYEKDNHQEIDAGFLFGISLYLEDEDYSYLPSYDVIGTLKTEEQSFVVIVEYPTDVQFTNEGAKAYHRLSNDIDDVIKTFHVKDEYSFKKTK